MAARSRVLALFDVDGTLTPARKQVSAETRAFMAELRKEVTVGVVGGSDFVKQKEQLGESVLEDFDYSFSENGLVAYKQGELIGKGSIQEHMGEENLKRLLNWTLKYMSEVDIPMKRGTFIEFRTGMLNISPIGRNCSHEERNEFEKYDLQHNIRRDMVAAMRKEFAAMDLTFSIGGQISFDVFPRGWDKTYCLQFVAKDFDEIHFFGDKTFEGGNDHEIFSHPDVVGHTVTSPEDTVEQCKQLFLSKKRKA
jgi:phosphomannomutase